MTEAVVVGGVLLPVYALTKNFIVALFPRMKESTREYMSVFLAGGFFHLMCEGSGVNDWYLDNGVAVLKRMEQETVDWTTTLEDPELCRGNCGWRSGGLCSHYSFHAQ